MRRSNCDVILKKELINPISLMLSERIHDKVIIFWEKNESEKCNYDTNLQ